MLSSINALRTGDASLPGSRPGTPPPPLISETLLDRARRALEEDSDSDDAMPSLETVTDSSSERSDLSEEEDLEVRSIDYGDEVALELVRGLIGSWTDESRLPGSVHQDSTASTPPPSTRFSTVVEREEPHSRMPTEDEDNDLPPPLEFIDPPQETAVSLGESRKVAGTRPSNAFTTDGRGRVISVGGGDNPSENNELNPLSTTASTTTTSDNSVEDNPAGSRLLSWITSMF
ncbi:hypothetical protein CPB83DRAFT_509378 [Crepidotus variabilis]|uniref:Uncharacterized protein n=1 Tax=Crepidotus variabilis TaxID=179855 RepID=A0A9P6EAU7_9AGAR|nr:hypothetical protein CPB83DRAFT_509378 [Crepidotus variabilis]